MRTRASGRSRFGPTAAAFGLALAALCLAAAPAAGRVWQVPGEVPTIQAGVDSAAAGDTVLVAAGVYRESLLIKRDITIAGETGLPSEVCINGGGARPCLRVWIEAQSPPVRLADLTLADASSAITDTSAGNPWEVLAFLRNCVIERCGEALSSLHARATLENCLVQDNGLGFFTYRGSFNARDSVLRRNRGTLFSADEGRLSASNCLIEANGRIVSFGYIGQTGLYNCTVADNDLCFEADYYACMNIVGCIFHRNGTFQSGFETLVDSPCCICKDAASAPMPCTPLAGSVIYIACTDMWGSTEGDWPGILAPALGLRGNIRIDPRFCAPAAGDYRLHHGSPLLPENNDGCGLIGAFGAGDCVFERPYLVSLADVPADQGGQLRLRWVRSDLDAPGSPTPITGYAIWRRSDGGVAAPAERPEAPALASFPRGHWEHVTTIPARGELEYAVIVPTLCDGTPAAPCWTAYFVGALTADPLVTFDSEPDSGMSVDNIVVGVAPGGPPGALAAARIVAVRPNPFNPRTTVVFALEEAGAMDLVLYDLAGRRIRALVAGEQRSAGTHEAVWDGRDEHGRVQPAGLYLCRLEARGVTDARRLILLK